MVNSILVFQFGVSVSLGTYLNFLVMGIFSKFQIKDIKTKILGGKAKHKGEVPSIAVSPPTPSVHDNFRFPLGEGDNTDIDGDSDLASKELSRPAIIRQRSVSLPDVFDGTTDLTADSNTIEKPKSYLRLPKSKRRKRRKKSRTVSCPDILAKSDLASDGNAKSCETNLCATGPSENSSGYYGSEPGDISVPVLPQLKSEDKEFGKTQNTIKNSTIDDYEIILHDTISATSGAHNGVDYMTASPSVEQCMPLCTDSDQQSEKSKVSNISYPNQKIQRRAFSTTERRKPDARWSLDLEKLGAGCSDNSLLSEDGDMKWDGQNSKATQDSKNLVSTWSLDLDKERNIDLCMGRAYSEINFGGSPKLRDCSNPLFGEKVIFNAKSLDLEFVKADTENIEEHSESNLEQRVHKRGIHDYVGKFNGIVSKFSTWSLDIELARKRSLEKELDGRARTQSELVLVANKEEDGKPERAVSYHSLLYDFDEASRYQIYQPTVYEVADENPAQGVDRTIAQSPKLGAYGNSKKFLSKQFESLYENGRNLYKQRYVIFDAIKQREKELKAIADKEAKAKQIANADSESHKFFKPKPKPPPRSRSTTHRKRVQKVHISPLEKNVGT